MFLQNPADRAGLAALLTIIWALIIMQALSKYTLPHIFAHDIDKPVLALELARGASDIDAVLHRAEPDKAAIAHDSMWLGNVLDLVFIPIYGYFLWSVARVFGGFSRLLLALILGTALFDYIEDWQIFRALKGANPPIYIPSLVKWGLLGLALLATAIILLRSEKPVYSQAVKRMLAIAYLASAGLLLAGVALGERIGYSPVELAIQIFSLIVAFHLIGLLGRHFSIPGIRRTYVENFCEERRRPGKESLTAVKPERVQ